MQDDFKRWLLKDKYGVQAESQLTREQHDSLQHDLDRLEAGEPLQYVIGWVDFLGARIDLHLRPLIPRPETEFWVQKMIEQMQQIKGKTDLKILDLCCGSGCIGIAMLRNLKNNFSALHADFADVSSDAVAQTEYNLQLNHLTSNFTLIKSDLFAQVPGKYDFIFSNPPYVDPDLPLEPELKYEPSEALFAADHGLAVIEKIIEQLPAHLNAEGTAVIEFGKGQEKEIDSFLNAYSKECTWQICPDQYGVNRYCVIHMASPKL